MSLTPAAEGGFRIKGWHVLAGVVGFFMVVIGVDVAFTVIALRTFPGQVSVTPYEDGLLYNRKIASLAEQAELGWRAAAAAEAGAAVVHMRGADGLPLRGLTIRGALERPATEAGRLALVFREEQPGRYVARPGPLAGTWDLTAHAIDAQGRRFEAERRLTWP